MAIGDGSQALRARLRRFVRDPAAPIRTRWRRLRVHERLPYRILALYNRLTSRRGRPRTLYIYPHLPGGFDATILRVADVLGLAVAPATPGSSPVVCWDGATQNPTVPPAGSLNERCTDIRKSTVQRVFRETFGHGYDVDPLRHVGPMVRKSDENATHDGRVIAGPIASRDEGYVYQRAINNLSNGMFEDLRVPIVFGEIPVVFIRRVPREQRFGAVATEAAVVPTESRLSPEEQRLLAAFAERIGQDFGEMDVLRDQDDGRIYVVDANKTPVGPPRMLSVRDSVASMRAIAEVLDRKWLNR